MATLSDMLARYGQHGTARIMQYEGYPVSQPRIAEALKPRKGRSAQAAEARYFELEGYAKKINLSRYPHGVPEGEAVVSSRTIAPPVYQKVGQRRATMKDIIGTKRGGTRVTWVTTGNAPHKGYDDSIVWEKPRQVVPELSLEKLIDTALARFGEHAKVGVTVFGVFDWNFGHYVASIRFPGFKEDFYVHHQTMGELIRAQRELENEIQREEKQLPQGDRKGRAIARAGHLADPKNLSADQAPGYVARWASKWAAFRYIEVNHIAIWQDKR